MKCSNSHLSQITEQLEGHVTHPVSSFPCWRNAAGRLTSGRDGYKHSTVATVSAEMAVLSGFMRVLCAVLLPCVAAEYCYEFRDSSGEQRGVQHCGLESCCGKCDARYCCSSAYEALDQDSCPKLDSDGLEVGRSAMMAGSALGTIVSVIGTLIPIIFFVLLCCCLCKKCRKRRQQRQTVVHTIIHTAPQPPSTIYQPSYPAYNLVPGQQGYMDPPMMPSSPPTYMEATGHLNSSAAFTPGQPMYPLSPPGAPHPQQHPEELTQPAYNPAYDPKPWTPGAV